MTGPNYTGAFENKTTPSSLFLMEALRSMFCSLGLATELLTNTLISSGGRGETLPQMSFKHCASESLKCLNPIATYLSFNCHSAGLSPQTLTRPLVRRYRLHSFYHG